MELFKNFFKTSSKPDMPMGRLEELKRHFIKAENVSAERAGGLEVIKRNYQPAIKSREGQYDQDVAANQKMENQRSNLETHNEIVLGYANELVKAHDLSEQDKVAVYLGVIFHDSGKLAGGLLKHHIKGEEYVKRMLDELPPIQQDGQTIEITPELKEKVLQAILRHMNHPFLVDLNKGERFPEPENDIDKIVFDADMMANVGFKNVCFRLTSEKFLNEDIVEASKKGLVVLEETFNNVMAGVRTLDQAVLSEPAKVRIKELIEATEKIFNYLKDNGKFQEIQDKYSENNEFNFQTIKQRGGVQTLKKDLNIAIENAAEILKIDKKTVENFIM